VQKSSQDQFIVFLDPDSRIYYRYYVHPKVRHIKVEEIEETDDLRQRLETRNMHVLYKIRYLLILPNFSWNLKEAESYRRRPFPIKFLQNECSPYPCYVF
jgi:hypothetical protein